MKKLQLFWSDFIGFIPNEISESITEGTIVESLITVFFAGIVLALCFETVMTATRKSELWSENAQDKKDYLVGVAFMVFILAIIMTLFDLLLYLTYPEVAEGLPVKKSHMTGVYVFLGLLLYGILKYFYLKRKYERKHGKLGKISILKIKYK